MKMMKKLKQTIRAIVLTGVLGSFPIEGAADYGCCSSDNWACWIGGAILGAATGAATGYAAGRGRRGKKGREGRPGDPGPAGLDGFNGHNGFNGESGANGAPGTTGAPGMNGLAGPIGPTGCSGCGCSCDEGCGPELVDLQNTLNFTFSGNDLLDEGIILSTLVVNCTVTDPFGTVIFDEDLIAKAAPSDAAPVAMGSSGPPSALGTYTVTFSVVTTAENASVSNLGEITIMSVGPGRPFINQTIVSPTFSDISLLDEGDSFSFNFIYDLSCEQCCTPFTPVPLIPIP